MCAGQGKGRQIWWCVSFVGSEYLGLLSVLRHSPPLSCCFCTKGLPSPPPAPRKNQDTYCVIFLRVGVLGDVKVRERVLGAGTLLFRSFPFALCECLFGESLEFIWLTPTLIQSNAVQGRTCSACSKVRIIVATEPRNSQTGSSALIQRRTCGRQEPKP